MVKKRTLFLYAVLVSVLLILSTPPQSSGKSWVEEWFENAIESGNSYGGGSIETSVRSYYFGGGASLRWQTGTISPFTVGLPRISFGCGGVDIFLGSLGLLDFDYMVNRLENIMNAAGAFAFKYALNEYCSLCDQILDALDATANFLNSLQLNECKAGQVLAMVPFAPFSKQARQELGKEWASWGLAEGVSETWHEMIDAWKGKTGSSNATEGPMPSEDTGKIQSGCPADIQSLFSQSMLEKAKELRNFPGDSVALIRSLVGDVVLVGEEKNPVFVKGCDFSKNNPIANLVYGDIPLCKEISPDNTCVCQTDNTTMGSLREEVKGYLDKYIEAIRSSSKIDDDTYNFLNTFRNARFPLYSILVTAYSAGVLGSSFSTGEFLNCATYYYAYNLIMNMLSLAEGTSHYLTSYLEAKCSECPDYSRCQFCNHLQAYKKALRDWESYLKERKKEIENYYLNGDFSESCMRWMDVQRAIASINSMVKQVFSGLPRE